MYEEYFTEEHRIFRESVRKFVEKEIKPHIDRWEDEELFPAELYKRCADEGFLGLGYPEACGGTPCDRFMSIVFTEEMIRSGSVGLVAGLGSHTIAMPPVVHLGTEEQKQRFLVPVLKGGEDCGARDHGAERRLRRREHPDPGGPRRGSLHRQRRQDLHYERLPGEFHHHGRPDRRCGIQGGQPACDRQRHARIFVAKKLRKIGWNASDTAELSFVDCRVPAENLLGGEGQGFYGIMANFQNERLAMAVMAHAVAALALEESIKYAKNREAFGRTLSGFQVTRHKLVDMATQVEVAREFNYRVASRMEAGKDAVKEVSMAKNFACQVCDKVVYDAVQLHGGYGCAGSILSSGSTVTPGSSASAAARRRS